MISTLDFYAKLPSFHDFNEVTQDTHFHPAPQDWVLVISDIRGSTKAIHEGRYREVNMVGAATFTAVINTLPSLEFPFVFGGDGTTLLIPTVYINETMQALKATQKMAQEMFGFELRVGLVRLDSLYKENARLSVAKYEVSPGNFLAMFRGGALAKAETLVKSASPKAQLLQPDAQTASPNLEGLTCRWEPFATRKGVVISLLVQARGHGMQEQEIYAKVIREINNVFGNDLSQANPIALANMKEKMVATDLGIEILLNSRPGLQKLITSLKLVFKSCLNYIFIEKNLKAGNFQGHRYKQEMIANADLKKFDDTLRMILDCTETQAQQIGQVLELLRAQNEIYYGIHKSQGALMTCLVTDIQGGKHVHFIDGTDGGYALAATQLKSQK